MKKLRKRDQALKKLKELPAFPGTIIATTVHPGTGDIEAFFDNFEATIMSNINQLEKTVNEVEEKCSRLITENGKLRRERNKARRVIQKLIDDLHCPERYYDEITIHRSKLKELRAAVADEHPRKRKGEK